MNASMDAIGILAGGMAVGSAAIATCAVISRVSKFYQAEIADDSGRRELPLDGLRGIAALMVVMHHAAMFRISLHTGEWGLAGSPVLQAFGPAGVHLFFMLTGYLFWSKARSAHGKFNIAKLWRGRVYRIAPLYLFGVVLIMAVAVATGKVHVANSGFFKSGWRLLGLGIIPWHNFGNFDVSNINVHVVWTLWYEWRFYLALPFIAWLAVGRRVFWLGAATYLAVFCCLFRFGINMQHGLVFILGMLCPVLLDNETLRAQLRSPRAAAIALVATAALAVMNQAPLLSFSFATAMFPVFLVAAAGNTFWGVLVRPAFRCLGAISYSLYLLHGIAFYVLVGALKAAGLTALPEISYWIILAAAAIGISAFCSVTYRWVEAPFLSRSHKTNMLPSSATVPEVVQSAL
jgi:peptidoglycan/LPS O-acetylase OafA/YrhL